MASRLMALLPSASTLKRTVTSGVNPPGSLRNGIAPETISPSNAPTATDARENGTKRPTGSDAPIANCGEPQSLGPVKRAERMLRPAAETVPEAPETAKYPPIEKPAFENVTFAFSAQLAELTANWLRSMPLRPMVFSRSEILATDFVLTASMKLHSGVGAPLGANCSTTWSVAEDPDASVAVTMRVAEPVAAVAATVSAAVFAFCRVSAVPPTCVHEYEIVPEPAPVALSV